MPSRTGSPHVAPVAYTTKRAKRWRNQNRYATVINSFPEDPLRGSGVSCARARVRHNSMLGAAVTPYVVYKADTCEHIPKQHHRRVDGSAKTSGDGNERRWPKGA